MSEYNDENEIMDEALEDEVLDASPPANGLPPKSDYDPTTMKDSIKVARATQATLCNFSSRKAFFVMRFCFTVADSFCSII